MGRPKIIRIKQCATCGRDFDPGSKHPNKLNCSQECRKIYDSVHKDERMKKMFDTIEERYGVKSFSQTEGFHDKIKKTLKERYGDENYNNYEQIKKTNEEKYGTPFPNQIPGSVEKTKQTKKDKYGDENYNNREDAKKTIMEKFGVEHHLQTEECMNKQKETNLERYGEEYNIRTEDAKEKRAQKTIELYGTEFYFSSHKHCNGMLTEKIKRITKAIEKSNLEFDINQYTKLREVTPMGKFKYLQYEIKCKTCNTLFESSLESVPVCRTCFPVSTISRQQEDLRCFLKELNINFIENNRKTIKPYELDFYIADKNIAIEINGNYYHSELSGLKDKYYHVHKTQLCEEKNIKLIHIFEDEWLNKQDIVKSRIKNMLTATDNKIYARKCEIKTVEYLEKKYFLENNHLQGNDINFLSFGLYYKDELISLITFSKPRLSLGQHEENNTSVELSRFCSKTNYNVVGAFERLLKHFIKNNQNIKEIFTYADCRWSGLNPKSTVYSKSNFKFIHISEPSYFYMFKNNYLIRYHRFTYNKQKMIKLFNADKSLTEWEIAQQNGMDKIYDCGTMKFSLDINQ